MPCVGSTVGTTALRTASLAVTGFVHSYNTQWLIGRHGHRTPKEAYQAAQITAAA